MKFGGTSVQDGPAMRRAVEIVAREMQRRPLVVVSAIAGATNALLEIGETALTGDTRRAQELLAELVARHRWILFDLDLGAERERALAEALSTLADEIGNFVRGVVLLRELTPRVKDAIAGYGERLSSLLFTAAAESRSLPAVWVDAAEVVVTDSRFASARPDVPELARRARERLLPLLDAGRVPIVQGFVGANREGVRTTLGRGGSDYSAALLGAALGAEEIQIWTDVPGMLTADNRIVPEGMKITELSFAEAAELAYFGAKVLHPMTIEPAVSRDIPVSILDARRPGARGTRITARAPCSGVTVKSIAAKKGITVINVRSLRMLMAHGFLRSIFEVFDRHEIPVDLVSTSEVSVSLTVDRPDRLEEVVRDLSEFAETTVDPHGAIVCLVGEELRNTPGIAARAFGALGDINIRMISQGASEINLSFVVREDDADEAVRRLHRELIAKATPGGVFEPVDAEARP